MDGGLSIKVRLMGALVQPWETRNLAKASSDLEATFTAGRVWAGHMLMT